MQALTIDNLSKTYANGLLALDHISLTVKQGDFFALLGPNGAGKSTTIGIITSLVRKSSGQVKVFDVDIDVNFAKAKSYIGVVPQEFNFNIFEKVKDILVTQAGFYGLESKAAGAAADKVLNELGLWDKRNVAASMLSGGMKRRLMIARALVHNPRLLILDEPTAGVDIELRRSMYDFLRKINAAGTTIILTTHYLEEAEQLCKNVAIIDRGRIIENTNIKELVNKLDIEYILLDLRDPLNSLPIISDYDVKLVDTTTLEVAIPKHQSINALFNFLSQQNIEVVSLRNKTNRLEEMFVKLTQKTR